MSRIINWIHNFIHMNRHVQRIKELDMRIERLEATSVSLTEEVNDIKNHQFDRDYYKLINDEEKMQLLNLLLSTSPVIWGDRGRLEISEKAAVNSCLFNTNSGRIKIGDYTFAGSGVSILAGSHDRELEGFLRRDAEYKEGFDIEIGNGVWLATNSTILGPCVIENDAIVAAGAVVVPGTHIYRGEIYAGVPAKKIGSVEPTKELDKDPEKLIEVISRENGLLFYSGWTEKKVLYTNGTTYLGHWTEQNTAIIYTNLENLKLFFMVDDGNTKNEVHIVVGGGEKRKIEIGQDPICESIETNNSKSETRIVIESDNSVFVSGEMR